MIMYITTILEMWQGSLTDALECSIFTGSNVCNLESVPKYLSIKLPKIDSGHCYEFKLMITDLSGLNYT